MSAATTTPAQPAEAGADLWAQEPSNVPGHARIRARIAGLHCSLCTGTIEKALGRQPGVSTVAVSLTHEQALVDYDPDLIAPAEILATLRDIGYELYDPRKLRPFEEEEAALVAEGKRLLLAVGASLLAIGLIASVAGVLSILVPASVVVVMVPISFAILRPQGLPAALAGSAGIVAPAIGVLAVRAAGLGGSWVPYAALVLAFVMVFGVARHILRMAYQSLRRHILNQHVMLEIGAVRRHHRRPHRADRRPRRVPDRPVLRGQRARGHLPHFLRVAVAAGKDPQLAGGEKAVGPATRHRSESCGPASRVEVGIEQVTVGDLVRVRPGERIPVDGRVADGHSAVDLSLVTGEPVPVERDPGEEVIGGSINGVGALLIEVTRVGEESFLAQIVRHVEDARALKPGILHLVDKILRVYAPSVLTIAALALVGWLVGSAALGSLDVQRAVFAGLAVLVMGYPCAVGIAAPLAIVRGAGDAADQGIIMRTGEAFQTFGAVTHILLDKDRHPHPGRTLPGGVGPRPSGPARANCSRPQPPRKPRRNTPLGQAIVTAAFDRDLPLPPVTDFTSLTGLGVRAQVAGRSVLVGRPSYLTDAGVSLSPVGGRHRTARTGRPHRGGRCPRTGPARGDRHRR